MSTDVTSPSPPAPSSLRLTGNGQDGSLAPAPPADQTPGTAGVADTSSAIAAAAEFTHGMTTSIGR
ncbi:hypothetical protein [Streptomyces sp. NPDC017260]|uniref:hypothetical protein n=1 Tax=unclassified Streptomyces TaxID=2593676 RepID=UPI0037879C12